MKGKIEVIKNGGITSPKGFYAGAVYAGIKEKKALDLGMVYSRRVCRAAGVFTTNKIAANPVVLTRRNLRDGFAQAIVANSGCANACTGSRGLKDSKLMAGLAAQRTGSLPGHIIVASTGVIGKHLPMINIAQGMGKLSLTRSGGRDFARAIMTTDTRKKEIALRVQNGSDVYTIAGVAKGAGMIHPNMATMFCFITTDAVIDYDYMKRSLRKAIDLTFNMITVDGDTSPSDMVTILANGMAANKTVVEHNGKLFYKGLFNICQYLAKSIVSDGEGATKLLQVTIESARNENEAKMAARTIANSALVKAAVHGNDPNWGRIIVAAGRSGASIEEKKIDLHLNQICLMRKGTPQEYDEDELSKDMAQRKEILIRMCLNQGKAQATGWGCDLSEEYVTINSAYTT
ncbi:MAG TPA: bifunctional glutamate N-acetyltransferase/amino-acid acetyltransferase ArgJ [Dehalococcoidia bacterium]|nr:bifunctional glutamate N-acetyltransferase/amino-acid acetyltransferase ArgJ [Dehalococcoidia bacterium]